MSKHLFFLYHHYLGRKTYLFLFLFLSLSCLSCTSEDENDYYTEPKKEIPSILDKDYSYRFVGAEKFMNLDETVAGGQGGASFGNYFFQGYNGNSIMDVFDLKKKEFVCRMQVPAPPGNKRYHVNTINFGNQFVNEEDKFPVLYVCSGYTITEKSTDSYVFVYRIKEVGEKSFDLELIQTITLRDFCVDKWTEAVIDNEHDAIWVKSESCIYRKFTIPHISEGDCILTPYENVLDEINLGIQPFYSHNQGHLFYEDRIILVTGVPSWGETIALVVINTLLGKREHVLDLFEIGLVDKSNNGNNYFEPESVIVYDGQVMICYRKAIYKLLRDEAH